jgi:Tol biopolymer transport system component
MQSRPLTYSVLAQGTRIERPYLAPSGGAVAWTQDAGGQQDVFVHSGGEIRRLTDTPENEGFAVTSDDATTVAFTRRSSETNIWQLFVRKDGAEGVLEDRGHHVQSAAISASGDRIAWENYGHISQADPNTVLAAGEGDTQPQHGDHEARQLKPQLSGDGATLLYQVSDIDSAESHLVVTSGGQTVAEIDNNTDAPTALSFDGSKVVYPTTDDQGFYNLAMLDRATGQTTVISAEAGADEAQPSVAANGDVVFQMTRYDEKAQPVRSIIHKTSVGLTELVPADPAWEPSLPQLSADGKTLLWLATSKQDPDQRQIRLAQLDA